QPRSLRSALLFCYYNARPRDHPSFPTRRSSDLGLVTAGAAAAMVVGYAGMMTEDLEPRMRDIPDVSNFPRNEVIIQKSHRYPFEDRKSTRLNSSHVAISYAVFCLKKKIGDRGYN